MNIFISSWVTHRDARYFPNPEAFLPERFETQPAAWTYFPFGGGTHVCLGRPFSMLELPQLAVLIAQTFDVEFLSTDIQPHLRIGLTPSGTLQVNLKRRRA
jgi:cytochrome P450